MARLLYGNNFAVRTQGKCSVRLMSYKVLNGLANDVLTLWLFVYSQDPGYGIRQFVSVSHTPDVWTSPHSINIEPEPEGMKCHIILYKGSTTAPKTQ